MGNVSRGVLGRVLVVSHCGLAFCLACGIFGCDTSLLLKLLALNFGFKP